MVPGTYGYMEDEERKSQASTLVEIICFISQKSAQKTVEQHFEKTGNHLLAHCAYEELGRVLLIVQLSPTADEGEHTAFLRLALQQGTVESFEYVNCYPVSTVLNPSPDRQEQMRCFPLRLGESWFPALDHPNKVYICLDKPFMSFNQTVWLIEHQAGI